MPGGPKVCELFLILYRTPFSTELKVNKTDVLFFRIFSFEQIILNRVTVATRQTAHRNQQLQRPATLSAHVLR